MKIINILLNIIAVGTGLFTAGALLYAGVMIVIILAIDPLTVGEVALAFLFTAWRIIKLLKEDGHEQKTIRDRKSYATDRNISEEVCDSLQSPVPTDGGGLQLT